MTHATLEWELSTYWHAGTGRGVTLRLDQLVRRDRRGLPFIPARTVKGLLRDAALQAEQLGWLPLGECFRLFGGVAAKDHAAIPGAVLVSPARLSPALRDAIAAQPERRAALFRTLFSTAIDEETGTVTRKALRSMEVVVPLVLEVSLVCASEAGWLSSLETALPLLRSAGSHRNRGLGRIGRLTFRTGEAAA